MTRRFALAIAMVALAALAACDEQPEQRVEAGVIEVIDYGFEDAGVEDAE